jgi:protein-disulfide isomerase
MPDLERDYVSPGSVRLAFKHLPLESIHPVAVKAAETVECAGRQGLFWEMHDRLFSESRLIDEGPVRKHAAALKLDHARFQTCLEGAATRVVREDMSEAEKLRITSTPTFLIGRILPNSTVQVAVRISGAKPYAHFQTVLNQALQDAEGSR